ncbi:hypothetical protein [Symbiobacterium terraclitae]|uniref:hypothetical protein n=1 Tax=Symbiobacterium terraclitae TaxID=557451 RepID=UPI0035B538DC
MREPGPGRPAEPGRSSDARLPGEIVPPQMRELLAQVAAAVRALNRLATALEESLARPPVHLQVERLEVQTLAFHLGDIDVEELQGELNIGITHSVRLQPPARGGDAEQGPPAADPPGGRGAGGGQAPRGRVHDGFPGASAQGGPAPGGPGPAAQAQDGPASGERAQGQPVRGTLRNSVVTRRRALMDPGAPPARPGASPTAGPAFRGQCTSRDAVESAPRSSATSTPECTPKPAASLTPKTSSESTPKSTPESTPKATPSSVPDPIRNSIAALDPGSEPLGRVQVWPPPMSEGSAADDEGTP